MSNRDADLKSFHSMLLKLDGGGINDELTEKMKECCREIADACLDRGGKHKASLILKLDFIMDHKDKIVEITPDIKTSLPKAPMGRAGMFWVNDQGEFLRENPRQLTLEDELEKKRMQDIERAGYTG